MKPPCPCKDCDRRKFLCHGGCKEYKEWKDKMEEIAKEKERIALAIPQIPKSMQKHIWRGLKK